MDEFKKEFTSQLYDYYLSHNQKIFSVSFSGARQTYTVANDKHSNFVVNGRYREEYPEYSKNKEDFQSKLWEHQYCPVTIDDSNIKHDFRLQFFDKNPKLQKDFLKFYGNIVGSIPTTYQEFLDSLVRNPKEAISIILKFPVSVWGCSSVPLEDLHDYLKDKGATQPELEKFFFSFLKARKTHVNDQYSGPKARDFLVSFLKGDLSKLEAYFDFFPLIKKEYCDIKLEIFEEEPQFSTHLLFNCKKIKKSVGMDNWTDKDYSNSLGHIVRVTKTKHNLDKALVVCQNGFEQVYQVSLYHNNPDFNTEKFKKTVNDFYTYFKEHSQEQLTDTFVDAWATQYWLQQALPTKLDTVTKKHKI
jgi:hypothetical protein